MENVIQFIHDLYGKFFGGLWEMVKALLSCFDVRGYWGIIKTHSQYLGGGTGIIAGGAAFLLFLTIAAIIFALVMLLRRGFLLRGSIHAQSHLIQEVNSLNREVMRLNLEKDKILSMKVSQIGLNPNEIANLTGEEMETLLQNQQGEEIVAGRFFRLTKVDEEMAHYIPPVYDNNVTLPAVCELFRNYCASNLGLYYEPKIIRLFLAAFSCTRLIILQGISGTGKTSLPYAFGKFLENDATIVSVQPSWRERSELFGYFNEFTKRYNETELLAKMYEATYNENIYVSILDEMNIARVEYYFAELLSIMEMPSRDEWIVDLVPNVWDNDPKKLVGGKLKLPENMWYVGTANNDDSTFAITDKVYDRAISIDIDRKGVAFDAPKTPPLHLNFRHFEGMLDAAKIQHRVSEINLSRVDMLDDYVIEHFRLAFGNRIVKQLREFVPAYVGCGGTELEGLDYVLCKKVFRKFESLNLSYIRDEIDGLCDYLDELFGKNTMMECKTYLLRLKKLM